VAEAVGEVVGEELLGGAELAALSVVVGEQPEEAASLASGETLVARLR
jgi:hypothetical protein